MITFARQQKFTAQLKDILEQHERYDDLAEEYLKEKNINKGVEYLIKAHRHHHTHPSLTRAINVAINYAQSIVLVHGTYRKAAYNSAKAVIQKVQPFACKSDIDSCLMVSFKFSSILTFQPTTSTSHLRSIFFTSI